VEGGGWRVARASGVPALVGSATTDTHRRQTSFDLVGNHDNQELRHKQPAKEGKKAEKKNYIEEQAFHTTVIRERKSNKFGDDDEAGSQVGTG